MHRISPVVAIVIAVLLFTPLAVDSADAPGAGTNADPAAEGQPRMVGAPGEGSASALPVGHTEMAVLGEEAWFVTGGGVEPGQIWRTDGTSEGTQLVTDRFVSARDDPVTDLAPAGDELYFAGDDRRHGNELWRTDGTAEGTKMVADLIPGEGGSYPYPVVPLDDVVLFWARTGDVVSLWRTDGTAAGTSVLRRQTGGRPTQAVRVGDHVVWFRTGRDRHVVWRSDGTPEGTTLVRSFASPLRNDAVLAQDVLVQGGTVYFAADDGQHGRELWRTDGTAEGTSMVADVSPGREGSDPVPVAAAGGTVFFVGRAAEEGRALWRTDGTTEGTRLVRRLGLTWDLDFAGGDSLVYFWATDDRHGTELWRSDGTSEGTFMLRDIAPGKASAGPLGYGGIVTLGDQAVFAARDGRHGSELWTSDGSSAGTRMIADIEPGKGGRGPSALMRLGDTVLFGADDGAHGRELWRTDGTPGGTWLVRDIGRHEADVMVYDATAVDADLVYLGTRAGWGGLGWVDGPDGTEQQLARVSGGDYGLHVDRLGDGVVFTGTKERTGVEPWVSDGTQSGTRMLRQLHTGRDPLIGGGGTYPAGSYPGPATSLGEIAYFTARDGRHGTELWRTDGTASGTSLVREIRRGAEGGMDPGWRELALVGETLYFGADDGRHGRELWRSDGTRAGTTMVMDIGPGSSWGIWGDVVATGDGVYFVAGGEGTGREVWHSDGTARGTRLVRDVRPGPTSSRPEELTVAGDTLFFVADDGVHGSELWRTDGTAKGTQLVADLAPGREGSRLGELTALGDELLFSVWERPGESVNPGELWRTDGTREGTQPFGRLPGGVTLRRHWSEFPATTRVGDRLFLAADDGIHGLEPWVTDGTPDGTRLVADLRPGPEGSDPQWGVAADGYLFFTADDGEHGRQWWQLPVPEARSASALRP